MSHLIRKPSEFVGFWGPDQFPNSVGIRIRWGLRNPPTLETQLNLSGSGIPTDTKIQLAFELCGAYRKPHLIIKKSGFAGYWDPDQYPNAVYFQITRGLSQAPPN